MTIRRVAKDVQFLGRTIKANEAGFTALGRGRRASVQGAAMTHVGGAAAMMGGAALVGLGAASKSFADFDTMASQAATQIGSIDNSVEDVVNNTARLRNEILAMMGDFPATAEEMSSAAYEIFSSADVGFGRGIELMKLFNQTAVAGMTDLETATTGAMTVLNNFGDPAGPIGKSKELMNDMFSIIRFGRIDLATLNTMMNQIAPAAAAADQKLTDVGGAIAVLTRRLGPGIASAGLARLFEIFQRKDFQQGMAKAGVAITDASGKLLPLPDIMERIMALGPKAGKTLQNFIQTMTAFGSGKGGVAATVQARRALVELIKHYADYIDIQDRSIRNNSQFDKQLQAQLQSAGVRWAKFTNRVRANVLKIGADSIPVFEDIGKVIGPVISAWEDLDSSTKASIISTFAAVAAFTLLGGMLTSFVGILRGLYGLMLMTSAVIYSRMIPAMIAWGSVMMMPGGAAYAATSLLGTLGKLAGVGAIGVGISLLLSHKGGEWGSIIGKMLLGAGAGFQVGGLPGAIIGAVTVPIIMKVIEDTEGEMFDPEKIGGKPVKDLVARRNEILSNMSSFDSSLPTSADWWNEQKRQLRLIDVELKKRTRRASKKLPAGSLQEQINAGQFGIGRIGEDVVRGIPAKVKKASAAVKKALFADAMTIEQVNAMVDKQLKEGNKTLKDWAEERANVMEQAADQAQSVLDGAVSKLESTYDAFLQANESAMGQLFQGPWLTSETFNLAEEWGITPAIQDLNKDLREQIKEFNTWQQSLKAIGARGAPADLVKMLEGLGPDAVDKLEVLRKASPKMFAQFVNLWKSRQSAVKRETVLDFNEQLKQWNKYGHDIAFEIIAGLRGEDVELQQGFERYITNNFSGALQKIKDDALAEFYRENPEFKVAQAHAAAVRRAAAKRKAQITENNANTYNIHQRPGETDTAFAKRVAWEVHRRKGKGKPKLTKKQKAGDVRSQKAIARPHTVRGGD